MSRTPFFGRPQLEVLEDRFAPGNLLGSSDLFPDLALLAGLYAGQQEVIRTTSDVLDLTTGRKVGESTVLRTDEGIAVRLNASGLEPGAYTLWTRVDAPGMGPISGRLAGHVVGQDGNLNFAAHVSAGEVLGAGNDVNPDFPSGPLQDPQHSRITLVVRYHGPADAGRIYEQTHTYEPTNAFNFLRSVHVPPS